MYIHYLYYNNMSMLIQCVHYYTQLVCGILFRVNSQLPQVGFEPTTLCRLDKPGLHTGGGGGGVAHWEAQ